MRTTKRTTYGPALLLIAAGALCSCAAPATLAATPPLPASSQPEEAVEFSSTHGPQHPTAVPLVPGMFLGKQWTYGPLVGRPALGQGYQPADGDSFAARNGKGVQHFILTSGMWWLRVGDRPQFAMEIRSGQGAYAQPGLLPDLGVSGQFRAAITTRGKTKWLDEFSSIDAILSPGSARWTCQDADLGITVALSVRPLLEPWGFAAIADVTATERKDVQIAWQVENARFVADKSDHAEFAAAKFAQLFVGTAEKDSHLENGALSIRLTAEPAAPRRSRLLCVWGYSDYNREGVADAYQRLAFRPFDSTWLESMKPKWFDHWIGGGLEPEKKFIDARQRFDVVTQQADDFWARQRRRLRITTPDARFNNVVNHVAAQARIQFEYPGFMHGLTYAKYGKINHGYYGFEAAGMHDEVADSLHLVAGTQDVTGRQRYNMTTFAISDWHEDMDFYFVEQCWYHWRWTGDDRFMRAIWPAARRALEHGLAVSDPDGDGLLSGYYEMWNADGNTTGGHSALQTAMGWAALRAGRDFATQLDDRDYAMRHGGAPGHDPVYARRYQKLFDLTERQYLTRFWSQDVGAWASAEVGGPPRPRPHTSEQNYSIWRGLGPPMQNYMAMRYIRENHHHGDLIEGSTFEVVNDWWPIQWSLHWMASGDACASFHSACAAGDQDGHWPVFQTIADSAYTTEGRSGASPAGTLWQGTGANAMEMEPLFLAAVVDGLFGVKPWFGENLLVLRPSPLAGWDDLELNHLDVHYRFHRDAESIRLAVSTPVSRRVRAELPVSAAVQSASLNGSPITFRVEQGVGAARVKIESCAGNEHLFEIRLQPSPAKVEGPLHVIVSEPSQFRVYHACVTAVHDPQNGTRDIRVNPTSDAASSVSFTCTRPGKCTVFLELQAGEIKWLHPLDLDVRPPWTITERYRPPLTPGGPALLSPSIDVKQASMEIPLTNGSEKEISGLAKITVAGQVFEKAVILSPLGQTILTVALGEVWDQLSPGTIPVTVDLAGRSETRSAVCWDFPQKTNSVSARMRPLALRPITNAEMTNLFSSATHWRIDYTGAQHGVDRRRPLPLMDEQGWVLTNSIMTVLEPYGNLQEQIVANGHLRLDRPGELPASIAGVPTTAPSFRMLALCCTQPHSQFPSHVSLKLLTPRRAEKLYLCTANLVKPLKCYYPAAEVVIHYADGTTQLHQMIPPYTMPSLIGHICPRALAVPIGQLAGNAGPVLDSKAFLSLTDVVLDSTKAVTALELRCVATETLLGVVGVTLLDAP